MEQNPSKWKTQESSKPELPLPGKGLAKQL